MNHLVFTIHSNHIAYRMNNQHGSHPINSDDIQSIINYLIKMINPATYEVL